MRVNTPKKIQTAICGALLVSLLSLTPATVLAQSDAESSLAWDITKGVLLDPTTYAPATMSYAAQRMDWNSSQPLFRNGWMERNHLFTISGRPNDRPISYEDGNRKIRRMALLHLQESVINNVAANVFERVLTRKYPEHRKLFKTLSWVERIAFSSYVSYLASVNHFKQAERNREMARQYGYR
jgi:hypothetical protein